MNFMKRTLVFSTMLIFALTMFSGCASRPEAEPEVEIVYRDRVVERVVYVEVAPPPEPEREVTLFPLTPALAERLETNVDRLYYNMDRLQLVLSGRATLERGEFFEHPFELSGMTTRIRNERIRHVITLDDSTKGEAFHFDFVNGNIVLSVSFEEDKNLYLNFVNAADDHYGLFYLSYISPEGFQEPGAGFIMYGGELFSLSYSAEEGTPYLLLVLTEYDIDRLFARTIPGRTVPTAYP